MKKFLLFALLLPLMATAKRHYNILKPGVNNWFQNVVFNQAYGIAYGDTVVLDQPFYGDVDFKDIRGVTLINAENGPQVELRSLTFYPGPGHDVRVIGTMNPRYKYGIRIRGSRFGYNYSLTGYTALRGVEIWGNATSVKIVHDTTTAHAFKTLRVDITDCHFRGARLEGLYLGASNSVGVLLDGYIARNRVDSMGWDAIQCRVGKFLIEDNICDSIGLMDSSGQNHGILVGSNTNGSVIRRNVVTNVKGYAVFNNGFGQQVIECNILEGAIMVQSLESRTDFQRTGQKSFRVQHNAITPRAGISLYGYFNKAGVPMTLEYTDNSTTGKEIIQAGVTSVVSNNRQQGVICDPETPPGKIVRYTLTIYKDGSYEIK